MSFFPYISSQEQSNYIPPEQNLADIFNILIPSTSSEDDTISGTECCLTNFDISKQIPLWVLVEKEERGGNELTVFDFVQKYYDWLYCDLECGAGSGYLLEDKFLSVIDVEKTKVKYLKRLYSTYFPEYDDKEQLKNKNGNNITAVSLGSFVKYIKTRFYLKKGTAEALKIFFEKIFSVPSSELSLRYPKKQILRLNGGAFQDSRFQFNAVTADRLLDPESVANEIIGSKLNYSRFQDGEVFTDYSYILTVGISQENYKGLYLRSNHPAGTNCIFELEINQFQPPGSTAIQTQMCEFPRLKHYAPYVIGNTYALGLTYTVGCNLSGDFGNTPSYFFPIWANGMAGYSSFFDIPIESMFRLCRREILDKFGNINMLPNPNSQIPIECP